MCGGSAPSGGTKYEWSDDMRNRWNNTLNNTENLSNQPFTQFQGERFEPINTRQGEAGQYILGMARGSSSPINATNAARDQIYSTLQGNFLDKDPYARQNQYEGQSPAFQQMLRTGMQEIGDVYKNVTEPETRAQMVMNGTLGGGAHQQITDRNQGALAKQLANYANQMQNQQYDRSANLYENYLGRGSQGYQNERQRMMGAIGAGQGEQGLAYERANQLKGYGDFEQAFGQKGRDFDFGQWQESMNWPFKQLDYLTNIYGRAQGGVAPNQAMYQSGGSGVGQGLGALLAGYGLLS